MANQLRAMKRTAAKGAQQRKKGLLQQGESPAPQQGQERGLMQNAITPEGQGQMTPEQQAKVEEIQALVTQFVYNEKTAKNIQESLKKGEYRDSVPATSLAVFSSIDAQFRKQKKPLNNDMLVVVGFTVFNEIMELGQVMQVVPENLPEEEVEVMMKNTFQPFIQKGLKDGTIDPIQLQKDTEPLMSPELKQEGMAAAGQAGLPEQPTDTMATDKIVRDKQKPLLAENEKLKEQNQKLTGAMEGIAQSQQQQGPGVG